MGYLAAIKQLACSLLVLIFRLAALLSHRTQLHSARFARIDELASLLISALDHEANLPLGVSQLNQMLAIRSTNFRRELGNLLVVAPTRGGKGLLATAQLLSWRHSVVVNDIKGDLYTQTAGYRSTLGPVFCIDPTGKGQSFDPLLGRLTEDELLSASGNLLHKANEGEGAIFTQRATVMLTQLFLAARLEAVPALPYTRLMIRAGLTAAAQRLNSLSPELATQFLDVEYAQANLSDRFLLSSWGTLSARMRPLLTETVIRSLAGSDFQPASLMTENRPTTIYLRWPERDLLTLSPLILQYQQVPDTAKWILA